MLFSILCYVEWYKVVPLGQLKFTVALVALVLSIYLITFDCWSCLSNSCILCAKLVMSCSADGVFEAAPLVPAVWDAFCKKMKNVDTILTE